METSTETAKTARVERTTEAEEKKILKKLVVNKGDIIKNLANQVELVKQVFQIEDPGARIIFPNFGGLTDQQRVAALLLGKYFACRLELLPDAALGISEIAQELGRPKTSLSGPVKELVDDGFVERLPIRKYMVAYNRIVDIVPFLLKKKSSDVKATGKGASGKS
jgi:hypothetical protein